jgi:hypothetical protein
MSIVAHVVEKDALIDPTNVSVCHVTSAHPCRLLIQSRLCTMPQLLNTLELCPNQDSVRHVPLYNVKPILNVRNTGNVSW